MTKNKSWGGRFQKDGDALLKTFNASVDFDQRLAKYDIAGSIAHATMLAHIGVLSEAEKETIITHLKQILSDIEENSFVWSVDDEDVHMNIEARLVDLVGDVGKKLHTGRSRNDQIATDIRLYLRDESEIIGQHIHALQKVLLDLAEQHIETIMPGFTHLQAAQPISFGHHLLAYFEMFARDQQRRQEAMARINTLPLGAAALAGTSYPIDRQYVADLLGFDRICQNSIDAVSDRDFAIEFCSFATVLMMHLSRFCEELILWSSSQFDFIALSDDFCTGSSIMPQKKNPDVAELIRGKTGRVYGHLMALLTLMKAQPLAYNKDNQEDKEPLFDTVDTVKNCLQIFTAMLAKMEVNKDKMQRSAELGYTTATDLADYLVKKGMPFRDAHRTVGRIVSHCLTHQQPLEKLTLATLQQFSDEITSDVFDVLSLKGSVNSRNHLGGTATVQVAAMIRQKRQTLMQKSKTK